MSPKPDSQAKTKLEAHVQAKTKGSKLILILIYFYLLDLEGSVRREPSFAAG